MHWAAPKEDDAEKVLEQSGVKGMRWGVRKAKRESTDFKQTVPLRNRHTNELSNKQIKKVNERINLESKYKSLNPKKIKKGLKIGKGVLAAATTATTVYTMYNSPAGKSAISTGKKIISSQRAKNTALKVARANRRSGQMTLF